MSAPNAQTKVDRRRVSEWLLLLAVICIPFQQALTLDIGFPLKASELLVAAGIFSFVVERRGRIIDYRPTWLIFSIAVVVLLSSVFVAITTDGSISNAAYPHGLTFDLAQYTAYAIMALMTAIAITAVLSPRDIAIGIGWAVRIAVVYVMIQLIAWGAGSGVIEAINGNFQMGSQYGVRLPRNGPFREGNYLGFFAATALFIAARSKDILGVILAVLLVFFSQSTGAMVGIVLAIIAMIILRPTVRKLIVAAVAAVVIALVVFMVPVLNRLVAGQLTKLGLIENQFGAAYGYSLRARTVNAETGFRMGFHNSVFGVGQGRYEYHYDEYIDRSGLPDNFGVNTVRQIANNAYAQIASETGLIALLLFSIMLFTILVKVRRDSGALVAVVVSLSVGLIAFPAWTNLTAWVVIGGLFAFAKAYDANAHNPAALAESSGRRAARYVRSGGRARFTLAPTWQGRPRGL